MFSGICVKLLIRPVFFIQFIEVATYLNKIGTYYVILCIAQFVGLQWKMRNSNLWG